jgi:beta-lactamase class A
MAKSRREFLKAAAAGGTLAAVPAVPASARPANVALAQQIVARFEALPGDKSIKILAPDAKGGKPFVAELDADRMLFAASAIKTFVLCEALRQADSPDVVEHLERTKLVLDSTVWSFGSPTFTPPDVAGIVSERTAMEAMITRSDNTATDMMFKVAGPDNVRAFIASAGLANTLVPDSTRALTGYLFGATDYKNLTWEQVQEVVQHQQVHPFLNSVQTFAASAGDFVSYYSRALQGEFFTHPQTLNEFRRVLTLCDFIYLVPLPLGVSAYMKSGNADTEGFHARAIAGGLYFDDQWVYFAFIINWYAASENDPATVSAYFAAINESLSMVVDSVSKE